MGERPQRHLVHIVDDAVAIGADEGEIARRSDEARFVVSALRTGFAEACRVADDAASPHGVELLQRRDGGFLRHGEEHRVRRLRQRIDRREAGMAANVAALRVYRPERAGKADALALRGDGFGIAPADHRNMAGLQQPLEIGAARRGHAPSGRRIAREMMWRWISEVPSQMRSSRASRHRRCTGNSSIRPMPPKICTVLSATRLTISEQ